MLNLEPRALLTAFPDLRFEVLGGQPADGQATGTVVAQWLMRGTNTGPWNGQPPTGKTVTVRGVGVSAGADGQVTSAEGYFDRQGLAEQLGFEMRPLPPVAGAERQRFVEQAQRDFQDFALVGDATWEFADGVLTLRIDLRG